MFCLKVNFDQTTVSEEVIDLLSNHLKEDLDRDVLKVSLKESLALAAKGTKLQNGPANDLLYCIIRSLSMNIQESDEPGNPDASEETADSDDDVDPDSDGEEEDNDVDDDESLSQILKAARAKAAQSQMKKGKNAGKPRLENNDNQAKQEKQEKHPKYGKKEDPKKPSATKNGICRFYLNGKCKFNVECRSEHPKICPKFRNDGDCEVKGCGGGCGFLHPNVCRNSLRDKTCSYQDCKFFHLKGTKTVEWNPKHNKSDNPNWRTDRGNSQKGPNQASKNGQTSSGQKTRKKVPGSKQKQDTRQKQDKNAETSAPTVTQEEKKQLGQTLEAIMMRLDAMEARTTYYPQQGFQERPHFRPQMSPAVPQPGSQTQQQWASQPPWMQTQTQTQ